MNFCVLDDKIQQLLGFIEADRKRGKRITGYDYAELVTNLEHEILSLGQLYRDRVDAEIRKRTRVTKVFSIINRQ